jgi:hypothetical protein
LDKSKVKVNISKVIVDKKKVKEESGGGGMEDCRGK